MANNCGYSGFFLHPNDGGPPDNPPGNLRLLIFLSGFFHPFPIIYKMLYNILYITHHHAPVGEPSHIIYFWTCSDLDMGWMQNTEY
jgi:hypothetical protein